MSDHNNIIVSGKNIFLNREQELFHLEMVRKLETYFAAKDHFEEFQRKTFIYDDVPGISEEVLTYEDPDWDFSQQFPEEWAAFQSVQWFD